MSRIYLVPDQAQTDHIKPKMAVHIKAPFNPMSVITKDKILEVFNTEPDLVVPCEEPVRDGHGGGWSRKINAWHLYTLMVYL